MIFRKWAAIATIAGALERKVWVRFNKRILFPNMYTLLVSGPGIGKTDAIRGTMDFLRKLPNVHLAPTSVSRASLADALSDAVRTIVRPGDMKPITIFNALTVCADELGTFMPTYEGEFMSTLNRLYDCLQYDERKRHMGKSAANHLSIPEPWLNMISGTTPGWLVSNLPVHAWSEGFASRLLIIYAGGRILKNPWVEEEMDPVLMQKLEDDLFDIHSMFGQFNFSKDVRDVFAEWYLGGQEPVPKHPKLEHYLPRRPVHLLKIALCLAAARGEDYVISMEDYTLAMEMLLEIEVSLPMVFREMNTGGDSNTMVEIFEEVERLYKKSQEAIPEHRIILFISKRVPAYAVHKIFDVMIDSNMLKVVNAVGPIGRPLYAPVPRVQHNV